LALRFDIIQEAVPPYSRNRFTCRSVGAGGCSKHSGLESGIDARTKHHTRRHTAIKALNDLRATLSALHAQQRVTHALASKPPQAGPLNSEQLVHRALLLMREVSPAYLRHMVATVDVLCWGEQLQQGGKAGMAASATPTNRSKPSRSKGG
jgi:Protein of unknown function (DUF2894)